MALENSSYPAMKEQHRYDDGGNSACPPPLTAPAIRAMMMEYLFRSIAGEGEPKQWE
jgi:hypothetical protein